MPRRKEPEDYYALAKKRGFEWLGPYTGRVTNNTGWRCPKGHEWDAQYHDIRRGNGCPYCANRIPKTPNDYHVLAESRGFQWLGPEVNDTSLSTWWRCSKGHEWHVNYNSIQQKRGCPYCAKCAPKKSEDYLLLAERREFIWLGPVVKSVHTNTWWLCSEGHKWKATYNNINRGTNCPYCTGHAPKTPEDYRILAESKGFEWLGPEVACTHDNTWWRCAKGHEWEAVYSNIYSGTNCPYCRLYRGETAIERVLKYLNIPFIKQKKFPGCVYIRVLSFDFYLHTLNILIEYNGEQHYKWKPVFQPDYEDFEQQLERDFIKMQWAKDNSIPLIIISYWDFDNIEEILRRKLKNVSKL